MPLMSNKIFNEIKDNIISIYSLDSKSVLKDVHNNIRNTFTKLDKNVTNVDTIDIAVSFVEIWLTREYTSQIGTGSVIDTLTGYMLDYDIMRKYCPTSVSTRNKLGESSNKYGIRYSFHKNCCQINPVGLSEA
ncbi:uncharacterized protein NPIL_413261, partial [Nephila pilipes]